MGVFTNYGNRDKLNHIQYIVMAYEHNAILEVESHPKDVGDFFTLYEVTGRESTSIYLKPHTSEYGQRKFIDSIEEIKTYKVVGKGKLFEDGARKILSPLFDKINKLESEIEQYK